MSMYECVVLVEQNLQCFQRVYILIIYYLLTQLIRNNFYLKHLSSVLNLWWQFRNAGPVTGSNRKVYIIFILLHYLSVSFTQFKTFSPNFQRFVWQAFFTADQTRLSCLAVWDHLNKTFWQFTTLVSEPGTDILFNTIIFNHWTLRVFKLSLKHFYFNVLSYTFSLFCTISLFSVLCLFIGLFLCDAHCVFCL